MGDDRYRFGDDGRLWHLAAVLCSAAAIWVVAALAANWLLSR